MAGDGTLRLRQLAEKRGRRSELVAMLLLVEVKGRESLRDAKEALLPRQQARISRAAEIYLAQRRGAMPKGVRFDTIVVPGRLWPVHVKDAWRPGSSRGSLRP
jgi:Holliday junction resolvase-like predicted endonuclease